MEYKISLIIVDKTHVYVIFYSGACFVPEWFAMAGLILSESQKVYVINSIKVKLICSFGDLLFYFWRVIFFDSLMCLFSIFALSQIY